MLLGREIKVVPPTGPALNEALAVYTNGAPF